MKKAMELTMNTIVVAALALIVLIVLVIVFTGTGGDAIQKIIGIGKKSEGKADCIVMGSDPINDKDGDGYKDNLQYSVTYKGTDGKQVKLPCECDWDKGNPSTTPTMSPDQQKYC
jgi:hypothetical protein